MQKILHLSWEVPDRFNQKKTKAVVNLIEESRGHFQSSVISFNRSSRVKKLLISSEDKNLTSIKYFGLPFGLFHLASLENLYFRVCERFNDFELLHGHKITFEGILCYLAHKRLGKRYVLTLRGDTDFKFIHCLPQYRKLFQKVAEHAEKIFCLTPWSANKLKELYPKVTTKIVILPNICYIEKFINKPDINKVRFNKTLNIEKFKIVTTFHLDVYKRKRFELALRVINKLSFPLSFFVIGSGSPAAEKSVRKLIQKHSLQDNVHLLGSKNPQEIKEIYSCCDLFLLPSKRESFGMAILEALSSGLPVLQTEGIGLDGYWEREPFFMAAKSEDDFVFAIEDLYLHKNSVKGSLHKYIENGLLNKFSVNNIVNTYVSEINSITLS